MNYGYDCKDWTAEDKERLAQKLAEIVKLAQYVEGSTIRARIEVDGSYPGVRIRQMTWMTDESMDYVIAAADRAFQEINLRRDYKHQ